MVASLGNPDTKPYGLHRLWICGYTDTDGTILAETAYRLPLARTLAFTENEDNDTLDGDDKASVAIQGKGATVSGTLEGGGLDLTTLAIITGAQLIESGVGPTLKRTLRKRGSDQRPYWRVEGQVISNGGGDNVIRIFRCKANGKIALDSKYGAFMIPSIDFMGTPMPGEDADYLWEIDYNATKTTLGSTPSPNPLPIPMNLTVGTITATSVALSWTDVPTADSYKVQQAVSPFTSWTDVTSGRGGEPTTPNTTVTTLTTATAYKFRVAGVFGSTTGEYCSPVSATTS
ncbi:fibronectin type III domain-containing protein [Mycobacterium sp. TY814]|uniref:fibronectin type III domain-containing protein n=1 Tax=Mycobacterium sp. TY814 TaxID=3050580 RepID=UPI002741184C|nr:fibronectin type III domain-containing protein [Mycobacterium sp. TY814]MDP7721784.1 fibronectin type III domain-containing protein [Mycobacterium sp. TY814]